MFRFQKGRDPLQREVWDRNKAAMLEFLRSHPNEQLTVSGLSKEFKLSQPTVRKHLGSFEKSGIVERDGRERPATYQLRPFWPMREGLVEKVNETLRYASQDTPPDTITFPLSQNELTRTDVTILPKGKEYSRQYKLRVKQAVSVSDKRPL